MTDTPFIDVSPMTDRERMVLRTIAEHETITASSLGHVLNLSKAQVGAATLALIDGGFVIRSRHTKHSLGRDAVLYWITEVGRYVAKRPYLPVFLMRRGLRRPDVSDDLLVAFYQEHGTVEAVTEAVGYADTVTVQRRLRRLRVTPGLAGRPRKEASA